MGRKSPICQLATGAERDALGQIASVLSVTREITHVRQGEEERKKLQEQLAQSQKMESVGRLAGGVAHDFNNMLAAILGHTEMALDRVSSDHPLAADLRGIQNAAQRSADLTRQLLAFARKQTVVLKVLDLNETVTGMLKMLGRLIGEDITLDWLPGAALWAVRMDPSQIDQVLANLCVNARDAITAAGGRITIETGNVAFDETDCLRHADCVPGEYVLLAVSDNGCGMDKETQERLFEPFFTTKGVGQGTGWVGNGLWHRQTKQGHDQCVQRTRKRHDVQVVLAPAHGPDGTPSPGRKPGNAPGPRTGNHSDGRR
jgi:signal transduction histidine kinase